MGRANIALFCLLTSAVSAQEAAYAPPGRWAHARGPASHCGRSQSASPESYGGILWSYQARALIMAPPLVWDGAVFVLDGKNLVALDAVSGKPRARIATRGAGKAPQPAVFARSVFLLEEGTRLVEYQLRGRRFLKRWGYEVGAGASPPTVHAGELYVATTRGLLRLRAGIPDPVWTAAGVFVGRPALLGKHVYALRKAGNKLELVAAARADGKIAASVALDASTGSGVALTEKLVAVGLPDDSWALLTRKEEKGTLTMTLARTEKLHGAPLVGGSVYLGRVSAGWAILRAQGKRLRSNMITQKDRPDLFKGTAAPVSLDGATIAFGPWCADINNNEILWNTMRDPVFRNGVRFNTVPLTHRRVLLVPIDGKSVCLIGPNEIG